MQQAYDQLLSLVSEFEEGNLDLEQSIPKFKKGLELAKSLKQKLQAMENQVKEIQAEFSEENTTPSAAAKSNPQLTMIEETVITSTTDDIPF
jgi:exodeoxyribonuclease VII small subunit